MVMTTLCMPIHVHITQSHTVGYSRHKVHVPVFKRAYIHTQLYICMCMYLRIILHIENGTAPISLSPLQQEIF